jgi:hypothetical protein
VGLAKALCDNEDLRLLRTVSSDEPYTEKWREEQRDVLDEKLCDRRVGNIEVPVCAHAGLNHQRVARPWTAGAACWRRYRKRATPHLGDVERALVAQLSAPG